MSHKITVKDLLDKKRLLDIAKEKKPYIVAGAGIVVVLLIALLVLHSRDTIARHPNMAAFCTALHASKGADNLSDKVRYLRNLEQYAPNDIYPTVHTMRVTYEQAQQQPANYFGLDLGITGSINTFNDYTSSHCQ